MVHEDGAKWKYPGVLGSIKWILNIGKHRVELDSGTLLDRVSHHHLNDRNVVSAISYPISYEVLI